MNYPPFRTATVEKIWRSFVYDAKNVELECKRAVVEMFTERVLRTFKKSEIAGPDYQFDVEIATSIMRYYISYEIHESGIVIYLLNPKHHTPKKDF